LHSDCSPPPGCIGNAIYFDNIQNDVYGPTNFATIVETKSLAYLKLRREGAIYTGEFSLDGTDWLQIGQHNSNINPVFVGVIAAQAEFEETNSDFDYFTLRELP
jgi:hypothetical protein